MPKKAYGKSALKALSAMRKTYGKKKGEQVFYATARKKAGKGSLTKAVRKAYRKKK